MTSLPDRPEFHFTPTKGWINDPYGLVYHGGVYHSLLPIRARQPHLGVKLSTGGTRPLRTW